MFLDGHCWWYGKLSEWLGKILKTTSDHGTLGYGWVMKTTLLSIKSTSTCKETMENLLKPFCKSIEPLLQYDELNNLLEHTNGSMSDLGNLSWGVFVSLGGLGLVPHIYNVNDGILVDIWCFITHVIRTHDMHEVAK